MSRIEESVEVGVPVTTAYNQWTQFESFPDFMEGVRSVEQRTPTLTHWVTEVGGMTREFEAEITEQIPDERITWASVGGQAYQAGAVSFLALDPVTTRIMLQLDFHPDGIAETVGDKLGFVRKRAQGDLVRFKEYIEARGSATGAWRGSV
jgi:uncharacterized membrane protein